MARLNKVNSSYVEEKEKFIEIIRNVFNKTPDESEREVRHSVFNTLLLYATYAKPHELEDQIKRCFPGADSQSQDTISYISKELRDINRHCVDTINKNVPQSKIDINFFTPEPKANKEELSKALVEMILKNTKDAAEERVHLRAGP